MNSGSLVANPANSTTIDPTGMATANLLIDYYTELPEVASACGVDPEPATDKPSEFSPGFALPDLDDRMRKFLAPATASWSSLGEYSGHRLTLLDLARNPGTETTKTFPSLLIVARAVEFIRRTGETVMIFSPTSANKGTALRDAVLRAVDAGLVEPEQLRVVILAPVQCRAKFRSSRLATDPVLRALNPLLLLDDREPERVKPLGRAFADAHADDLRARTGMHLWYTLALPNYLVADTARAFFEFEVDPPDRAERPRVHAHAVSSAFGLLGYHRGRAALEARGAAAAAYRPASLLVQHLSTADMVLSLCRGGFDAEPPRYQLGADGRFAQSTDPHFPFTTDDPAEVLDPTFYTRRPFTSVEMNSLIGTFGGTGIVVSRHECEQRYADLRARLAGHDHAPPADPGELREWSLAMAFTGVCNAIDRGLLATDADVVIHGSGWYSAADFEPLADDATVPVATVDDIASAVC